MFSKKRFPILVLLVTVFGLCGHSASPAWAYLAPGIAEAASIEYQPEGEAVQNELKDDLSLMQETQVEVTVNLYHLCSSWMLDNGYSSYCEYNASGSRMLRADKTLWRCSPSDEAPYWLPPGIGINVWNNGCGADPSQNSASVTLDIEEYVRDVVPAETPNYYFGELAELYKAQSVAARSYTLSKSNWGQPTRVTIDNSINNQIYIPGSGANAHITQAVQATEGEVLFTAGSRQNVVLSESVSDHSGNWTEDGVYSPDGHGGDDRRLP